jgi:hypothetical protein
VFIVHPLFLSVISVTGRISPSRGQGEEKSTGARASIAPPNATGASLKPKPVTREEKSIVNPAKRLIARLERTFGAERGRALSSRGSSASSFRRPLLTIGLALALLVGLGVAVASATAPTVAADDASSVSYTTAHVSGTVDPQDQDTTFHFEYVTDDQFNSDGFSSASQTSGQGPLAANSGSTPVSDNLANLQPGTTYHLRLVADNTDG